MRNVYLATVSEWLGMAVVVRSRVEELERERRREPVATASPPVLSQGVCLTQISWSVAKPSDFALATSASTFALGGLGERERIQR